MPYRAHLRGAEDLITSSEQARAALIAFLVEKAESAIPLIEQAKALRVAALTCQSASDLQQRRDIRPAILLAAGLTGVESQRLHDGFKDAAVRALIDDYLLPRGEHFVDELVYRFLLSKGMGLTKTLRKLVTLIANRNIARGVAAALLLRDIPVLLKRTNTAAWQNWDAASEDPPLGVRGVAWAGKDGPRTLLFNSRVAAVGRSVNVVLKRFSSVDEEAGASANHPSLYLALGEVKCEFDPAVTAENWDNIRTSLERIKTKFDEHGLAPYTFYIGGMITEQAAAELWQMLQDGELSNAANSNDEIQLGSICQWLIQI